MYYAEFETDKYIREIFFKNKNENMTMIEVGAGPTEFYSMSKHFRDSGWRAISIDPNPKFVNQHKIAGNEIYQYACSNECKKSKFTIVNVGWDNEKEGISSSAIEVRYSNAYHSKEEIEIEIITLNKLLDNIKVEKINLLSVDTAGWELEVMQGFNVEKYNPEIILLENYLHDDKYIKYMDNIGYILHNKIQYNYIFCKK